jgi:hypothetical protein
MNRLIADRKETIANKKGPGEQCGHLEGPPITVPTMYRTFSALDGFADVPKAPLVARLPWAGMPQA